MPQAQVVIWSLVFLATPGLIFPIKFATANLSGDSSPEAITHALQVFRQLVIETDIDGMASDLVAVMKL